MDFRPLREALRLLRNQSNIGVRDIEGLDKSTITRIENTRDEPDYQPELRSIVLITAACGYTLPDFFKTLDDLTAVTAAKADPDLLGLMRDERTVKQMRGFFRLPEELLRGLAAAPEPKGTHRPGTTPGRAPRRAPKTATRTKRREDRRQSPGHGKTGT